MNSIRDDILYLFQEGIKAASPKELFQEFSKENMDVVEKLSDHSKNQFVFSLGKAAYSMAESFSDLFSVNKGYVLTKYNHLPLELSEKDKDKDKIWTYREASHPLPDENSIRYALEVLDQLKQLGKKDRLVVLLSGGGSSLFEVPIDGLSLQELINIQNQLLKSGKSIQEINSERKKYSKVKGGKLLKELNQDLEVYTLVISDVIGDDPNSIASGPTYPSQNYFIIGNLTRSIHRILEEGKKLGYQTKLISDTWSGSSEETSYLFEEEFNLALDSPKSQMIVLGGEMVCPVLGDGIGGRNQETALRVSLLLDEHPTEREWTFLSGGTDGTDGPTDVAGGIVGNDSIHKMEKKGWNPKKELHNSNSYPILKDIDALVSTGPTGTNVNDILILLVGSAKS
ncbi:glycerate kinase type-2 family protein [Leptospira levettii]|uniref:glycerate kinase type-2 family protein n=1 Tax=Leptospira levettii TaxID=2023178 RepID=UPI0010825C6E|nr:DUF4147 domain-containing protein [Leptospira levettii]MCW7506378.1 DUF4147 domain-containing protein [Leptospira levettii]MCW7517468.1 DUF4147 domain-containing protein [Leptospira levettii]TGL01029.1 DUF4147 domain-containing protein [Leptospira levettii]TGL09959.1 DUF4147 domain-containing protein [Leptospira levettii]